jgi:hypothetical protein
VFRQKCIDLSVLPDLSDQDMENLARRRRKILRAISNLGNGPVFRMNREIQKRYFQLLEIMPS